METEPERMLVWFWFCPSREQGFRAGVTQHMFRVRSHASDILCVAGPWSLFQMPTWTLLAQRQPQMVGKERPCANKTLFMDTEI